MFHATSEFKTTTGIQVRVLQLLLLYSDCSESKRVEGLRDQKVSLEEQQDSLPSQASEKQEIVAPVALLDNEPTSMKEIWFL